MQAGDRHHQVEGPLVAVQLLLGPQRVGQDERPQQKLVELLGEDEAEDKAHRQGHGADDQPAAQFDQMVEQRGAGGLDLGLILGKAHDPASEAGAALGFALALGFGLGVAFALGLALGFGFGSGATSGSGEGSSPSGSPSGPTWG